MSRKVEAPDAVCVSNQPVDIICPGVSCTCRRVEKERLSTLSKPRCIAPISTSTAAAEGEAQTQLETINAGEHYNSNVSKIERRAQTSLHVGLAIEQQSRQPKEM